MGREIKFKIWLPGIKKMSYEHTLEELMNWGTKEWTNGTAVFLQYTGLKDKNGREIYEGDIVETFHKIFDREGPCLNRVEDIDYCWKVVAITNKNAADAPLSVYAREIESIVVIGNIYENPELLEV